MQEFNIGDKVKYTGEDFIGLHIDTKEVYTVSSCNAGYLKLKEIIYSHSYKVDNFVHAEVKEEPKQMKPTDKITVEITLAELAKIYAVMGKCNGETTSSLFELAGKTLDPENKCRDFMDNIESADTVYFHRYEKEFMSLMFPEPPKKSKEQIKIEELEILLMDTKNKLEELKNISK